MGKRSTALGSTQVLVNLTPQDNHRIPVSALPAIPPQDETSPASEPDSAPANTLSEVESINWIIFIIKIFQKLPCDHTRYSESYKESRTITEHLGLDPEIESSICCPKCFRLYKDEDALTICAHHRSKKAQVCREGLFKTNANKLLPGYQPVSLIRRHTIHLLSSHSPLLGIPHSALQFLAEMVSERGWH
ncbi:hypothetical protein PSHT_15525 [Puccinia striiformis]|uniref:Uncharacterized protein n=1 Tax=Puccinia striiformis TaxID=27350 RepID=A0A2S4UEL3_9BASI|nr:hypothetical protein PSHT_15525 [Puccinia striiformis]